MNILFLAPYVPFPFYTKFRTGGTQLRNYNFLRELARRGHKIDFYCFGNNSASGEVLTIKPFCENITIIPNETQSLQIRGDARFIPYRFIGRHSLEMQMAVDRALSEKLYDAIHVSTILMAPYIHQYSEHRVILDYVDSFTLYHWRARPLRRYLIERDWNWFYSWFVLWRYERWLANQVSIGIYVSKEDAKVLGQSLQSKIRILPMGISFEAELAQLANKQQTPKQYDILFAGDLGYDPNSEAAIILLKSVLPIIRNVFPTVHVCIAGRNPPPNINSLASEFVTVTGYVENIAEYFAKSRIFVCPMRRGAGIKIKLIEAMACQLPIVATRLGLQGLGGQDQVHYLVEDSPKRMAQKIVRLLQSSSDQSFLAQNAYDLYKEQFVWQGIGNRLEECYRTY